MHSNSNDNNNSNNNNNCNYNNNLTLVLLFLPTVFLQFLLSILHSIPNFLITFSTPNYSISETLLFSEYLKNLISLFFFFLNSLALPEGFSVLLFYFLEISPPRVTLPVSLRLKLVLSFSHSQSLSSLHTMLIHIFK